MLSVTYWHEAGHNANSSERKEGYKMEIFVKELEPKPIKASGLGLGQNADCIVESMSGHIGSQRWIYVGDGSLEHRILHLGVTFEDVLMDAARRRANLLIDELYRVLSLDMAFLPDHVWISSILDPKILTLKRL